MSKMIERQAEPRDYLKKKKKKKGEGKKARKETLTKPCGLVSINGERYPLDRTASDK